MLVFRDRAPWTGALKESSAARAAVAASAWATALGREALHQRWLSWLRWWRSRKHRLPNQLRHWRRDIAPELGSLEESNAALQAVVALAEELQAASGKRVLWGTAQLFKHPRYAHGAATSARVRPQGCVAGFGMHRHACLPG